MCGRFTRNYTWQQIHALYRLTAPAAIPNLRPIYNVCPTDPADTILANDGKHEFVEMRWGLVPFWWSKPLKELRLATFKARRHQFHKLFEILLMTRGPYGHDHSPGLVAGVGNVVWHARRDEQISSSLGVDFFAAHVPLALAFQHIEHFFLDAVNVGTGGKSGRPTTRRRWVISVSADMQGCSCRLQVRSRQPSPQHHLRAIGGGARETWAAGGCQDSGGKGVKTASNFSIGRQFAGVDCAPALAASMSEALQMVGLPE